MVNKDQLEQTPEGRQVVVLMAENFTTEQFQPALTLIEQLYTEDQTVWDAEINRDSKHPFNKTDSAQRLLLFFANPSDLAKVKDVLAQREQEARVQAAEAAAPRPPAPVKLESKVKIKAKVAKAAPKTSARKVAAAKTVKKKPLKLQRRKSVGKRPRPRKSKNLWLVSQGG